MPVIPSYKSFCALVLFFI